ncbi:hypothetical protein ACP275_04G161800 [Erythranthe tilingii]
MNSPLQIRLTQFLLQQTLSPNPLFQIHSLLITTGLQSHHPSALFSLYKLSLSNPSTLSHAATLFPQVQEPNKWSLMIRHASAAAPLKALSLFREMRAAAGDDPFVYASLIKACNKSHAFLEGKSVHCRVIRLGLDSNVNVSNSLVSFYMGSANLMGYADVMFDAVLVKSVVSVNCMISGNVDRGKFDVGLSLFVRMLAGCFGSNVRPDYVTFVILVSGCVKFGGYRDGNALRCCCFKMGLGNNIEICNALIDMYAKFGRISDAESVFSDVAVQKDLVSWNSLMWGYANSGDFERAFSLLRRMRIEGVGPDIVSFSCLLSSCRDLRLGAMIHARVKSNGMEFDVSVGTALISMYANCRKIESARKFFDDILKTNIEYWNTMIHAYINNGLANEGLKLFDQIKPGELDPDEVTLLGLITACRDVGELNQGIILHSMVESDERFKRSLILGNALIDMYAKCGTTAKARGVFDGMRKKDVVSWTSMVVAYALNGEGEKSVAIFKQMRDENFVPNSVTFVGVLSACSHSGLVDEGRRLYEMMCDVYNIEPEIEHCGCMVDMFARAGKIEDARVFIGNMPMEPSARFWRMLVNGCRVNGEIGLGLRFLSGVKELEGSNESEDFVISSNVYAEAGRWGDVVSRREFMVVEKGSKVVGKSFVSN